VAQKVAVTLIDDLTGEAAEETVSFGLDGQSYEIDLSGKNAKGLRDALAQYIGAGRRVSGRGRAAGGASRRSGGADRQRAGEIRAWARKKGLQVNERGRIPADVVAKYEAANK
jgi:hypothetical protein